jgi:hypothetical protein
LFLVVGWGVVGAGVDVRVILDPCVILRVYSTAE